METLHPMVVLFTDYGAADIYVGQLKGMIARYAPKVPVVDLLHDITAFDIRASAHLLAALEPHFPVGSAFCCVIDPGVGSSRAAVAMRAQGRWFVAPDNGLLSVLAQRVACADLAFWRITWRPPQLGRSFHGRGLFAPVAAWLASGQFPNDALQPIDNLGVLLDPADFAEVIYVDHYGNLFTGIRATDVPRTATVTIAGRELRYAEVFAKKERK